MIDHQNKAWITSRFAVSSFWLRPTWHGNNIGLKPSRFIALPTYHTLNRSKHSLQLIVTIEWFHMSCLNFIEVAWLSHLPRSRRSLHLVIWQSYTLWRKSESYESEWTCIYSNAQLITEIWLHRSFDSLKGYLKRAVMKETVCSKNIFQL